METGRVSAGAAQGTQESWSLAPNLLQTPRLRVPPRAKVQNWGVLTPDPCSAHSASERPQESWILVPALF